MSKKWLFHQLKHHVSATACNSFWELAFKYVPLVLSNRRKKVPGFVQQRKKLYDDYCPPVHMEFTYRNKEDDTIIKYEGKTAPLKQFRNVQKYEKLYELGHVKVNK